MKSCSNKICKQVNPQPLSEFNKHKLAKGGLTPNCKSCLKEHNKKWHSKNKDKIRIKHKSNRPYYNAQSVKWTKANPDRRRDVMLRHRYDISLEQYNQMLVAQNNVCALCKRPETGRTSKGNKIKFLSVDHCHATNKVRGLLCGDCNRAIGLFRDNSELCFAAGYYLKPHEQTLPVDLLTR